MPPQLSHSMENSVTLYGASGHAKVIIDILLNGNVAIEAVVDDNPKIPVILGYPVVKTSDFDLEKLKRTIISIGNNKVRKKLSASLQTSFATAIHPSVVVSPFATIGEGSVLMANVVVNPDAVIGKHCIINTAAVLEHDCQIGDFAHISPGVSLAGNVKVGVGAHVGIGATVIQGITIGKWSVVGAGTVVIKDVPDYAVVVGNPGRVIRFDEKQD